MGGDFLCSDETEEEEEYRFGGYVLMKALSIVLESKVPSFNYMKLPIIMFLFSYDEDVFIWHLS